MSLKSKIQEMIDVLKFFRILKPSNSNSAAYDAKPLTFSLPNNINNFVIPSFFTNLSNFFYNFKSEELTVHHNGIVKALINTFYLSASTITLDFVTKNCVNFNNAFGGNARYGTLEIVGEIDMTGVPFGKTSPEETIEYFLEPTEHNGFNAFKGNSKLKEIRFKENSIPYYCWDMNFSATDVLSEDSLLSIANGIQKTPDEIIDDETAMIIFSSTTLENMPQYIKDIFAEKRCFLG